MQLLRNLRTLNRIWLPVVLVTGLTACASQGPVPEDRYYQLSPAQYKEQPSTSVTAPLAGRLGVGRLRSDGLRDERTLLYVQQERPLEILRYHYHHWVDAPTRLIQQHMLAYLRTAGVATEVVQFQPGIRVEHKVKGRLVRFERMLAGGGGRVLVELELGLHSGADTDLALVRYRAEVVAQDDSLHATVVAFSVALEQIYARFLDDIYTKNGANVN